MAVRVVCFDLGGVLLRVETSWAGAMTAAGIEPAAAADVPLEAVPAFLRFQAGELDLGAYAVQLAAALELVPSQALAVHERILGGPTPGTPELVGRLRLPTGCLSNTNAPHWAVLTDPRRYPHIAGLRHRVASHLVGANKPDPRAYAAFEALAGVEPQEVLFFDDSATNVCAALAAGWNAVRIDPTGRWAEQIERGLARYGAAP